MGAPATRRRRTHRYYYIGWLIATWNAIEAVYLATVNAEQTYPLGCSQRNAAYDLENAKFPPTDGVVLRSPQEFLLVRRLGAGKFSDVFEAVDVQLEKDIQTSEAKSAVGDIDPRTLVVVKCLKPVAERKIRREVLVLQHASKLPNLARLMAVVLPPGFEPVSKRSAASKAQLHAMPSLVLEHAGINSQWLCHPKDEHLQEEEIRYYVYHLLVALDHLHGAGIMHRDVKPRNVLVDRTDRSLMLIDLGLADFYLPNTKYNVRVASRHYKSPELLLGHQEYDYSLDLWGIGCILAGLLLRREPFFRGKDNLDQLGTIVAVLGTADLHAYISKHGIEMTPEIHNIIAKYTRTGGMKQDWASLASLDYQPSVEGIDLISKLLVYDHSQRLTAKQAMDHSFFDSVRDRVSRQIREKIKTTSA